MPRFFENSEIQVEHFEKLSNPFVRLLASEAAHFGVASPLMSVDQTGLPARVRYAPMQRLLSRDDEHFLLRAGCRKAAVQLRREHRRCYREFLRNLKRELRNARRLQSLAMASTGQWDFWSLLANVVLSESSLLYLSWLGWKATAGIAGAARDAAECLNFLFTGPRLVAEAT
jgi:hypothetical protein